MREDWEKAIAFVLKMEGGAVAVVDPGDPGGLTKYGISQKSFPMIDIANLTEDQAKELYRNEYWTPCKCDDLPTPFAIGVLDCAVNQGVGKAKRLLQMALEMDPVDGIIGPKTIAAAAKYRPSQVRAMLTLRCAEYARLMSANPKLLKWAENWFRRVLCLAEIILKPTV